MGTGAVGKGIDPLPTRTRLLAGAGLPSKVQPMTRASHAFFTRGRFGVSGRRYARWMARVIAGFSLG